MDEYFCVGVDEAGRGALAGPLVVGAVLNDKKACIKGLNDSKKLSEQKRIILQDKIKARTKYLLLFYSNIMIDYHGLSFCLKNALQVIKMHFKGQKIIFDGNCSYNEQGITTMIKADSKVKSVMAASILAKCARDEYMSKNSFEYDFASHKGYGTKAHIKEIKRLGLGCLHRKSFHLKELDNTLF